MITVDSGDVHAEDGGRSEGMRRRRRGDRRACGSAQLHHVAVREILDDIVCLAPLGAEAATPRRGDWRADAAPRRDYRAVLAVSSVNYTLKSEGEQEAITASYQAFLNGLAFPVQVLVRVVPLDLGPYLAHLQTAVGVGQDEAPNASVGDESASPPKTHLHLVASDPEIADDPDAPDALDAAASTEERPSRSRASESIWAALARDHVRFVRDLAARHTLLERRFYVIVPADGETTGGTRRRGRGMHSGGTGLIGWLPGRRARVRRAAAEHVAAVRQQLDLRSGELIRQLGRIGLEARRLRGAELAALFATCLSPGRAARHPLPPAVVHGVGHPISRASVPIVLPVPAMEPAGLESWEGRKQS